MWTEVMYMIYDLFSNFRFKFFTVNIKAKNILFWSSITLQWFLLCCFLHSCTSHMMGKMLRWDHTNFKKLDAKRPTKWNTWVVSGMINPSWDVLTRNMCGHFHFLFSTSTSSWKNFLNCITFKFWKFTTVHILVIKESGTCQKLFS